MHGLHQPSARRTALLLAGLALFLMGTNYCLVGAIAGPGRVAMACMAPPSADADAMPAGHCHGKASSSEDQGEAAPTLPCCVAYAPVVAPGVVLADPGLSSAVANVTADAPLLFSAPIERGHLLRAPPGAAPPVSLARAPLSSRAPPLA